MNAEKRFGPLLEKYLEGKLSAAERQTLQHLLADEAGWRAQFIQGLEQEAALRAIHGGMNAIEPAPEPAPVAMEKRRPALRWLAGLTATVAMGVAALLWTQQQPAAAREVAKLEQLQGEVYVLIQQDRIRAREGQSLFSGQGVQIVGDDSRAVVHFANAGRLELGAGTAFAEQAAGDEMKVTLTDDAFLVADLAEQPASRRLVLVTPHAEVAVRNGKLSLSHASEATHIEVEEGGGVQMTRRSDGKTIEVQTGFAALAAPQVAEFGPEPLAPRLTRARTTLKTRPGYIAGVAFSPDGRLLAAGTPDGLVQLWEAEQESGVLGEPASRVRVLAFSAAGRLAVTNNIGEVRLWDTAKPERQATLAGHTSMVYCMAFSPDGKRFWTAAKDGQVKLWDTVSGKELRSVYGPPRSACSAVFSADLNLLAVGDWHNTVKLWDLATGKLRTTFRPEPQHVAGIFALAFSPDGQALAAASSDGSIRLYDLATNQARITLYGHKGKIEAAAFSPDGQLLATGGRDGTVRIWDVARGREQATIDDKYGFAAVAFSPDGKTLATGSRSLKLWDVQRGKQNQVPPAKNRNAPLGFGLPLP